MATSPPQGSDQNMKQNLKNSPLKFQFQDEEIMAGFKFKMQYLGCSEELKFGGTDHEIANVIHDIHALYTGRNTKLSKARTVVAFVDAEKINIFDENEDEMLKAFPLVFVKDVTTCLDQAPYSKTCVLVAKQYNDPLYKAFVFYSKTSSGAAKFYHFTTSAFQLGFRILETLADSSDSESTAEGTAEGTSRSSASSSNGRIRKTSFQRAKNDDKACLDDEDGDCDSIHELGSSFPESQKLLSPGNEVLQMKEKQQRNKSPQSQHTITVKLRNNDSSFARHEKQEMKFNLHLGEENNNQNTAKIGVFKGNVNESSRLLIPGMFRNSYRKFRKMSGHRSGSGISTEAA